MSRLLKILLYAVVLFFLFLWLSTIVKSCGADKGTSTPTTTTASTDDSAEETYDQDDFFEDESEDDDTTTDDPSDMSTGDEEQIDYTEIDKVVEEKLNDKETKPSQPASRPSQSTSQPSSNRNTTATKGSSSGKYMVMAGSFLIEKNAEKRRKRLNSLGYDNADIVVFDLSQYHSVVAARFSTYEAALKVSNELKRRGMDCYVHAQQF